MSDCTYCGEIGGTRDHVIPLSVLRSGRRQGGKGKGWGETVPACTECNVLLGTSLLPSMDARAGLIAGALARRYGKLLTMPEWTEAELGELGPDMRRHVTGSLERAARVRLRIAYARYVASGR